MYKLGIDIGGTNIAMGIIDDSNNIIARDSIPTNASGREYDEIIAAMGEAVNRLIKTSKIPLDKIEYIGLGAPGILDNASGTITDNSNIHWVNYPIKAKLQQYINKPVFLGNDANVAAWAEYNNGCGKGSKTFVMLTLGTGIGGGIILNGRLHTGAHNTAAEIGHATFISGGEQCGCGKKGCIEAYCSATALIKFAKRAIEKYPDSIMKKAPKISAKTVIDAYKAGDKAAQEIFEAYTDNLAEFIGSIINVLDPDIVALGGGVANAGEVLLAPVREKLKKYILFTELQATRIMKAEMGNDAGIIGAALLGEQC